MRGDDSSELRRPAAVLDQGDVARGHGLGGAGGEGELMEGDVPPDGGGGHQADPHLQQSPDRHPLPLSQSLLTTTRLLVKRHLVQESLLLTVLRLHLSHPDGLPLPPDEGLAGGVRRSAEDDHLLVGAGEDTRDLREPDPHTHEPVPHEGPAGGQVGDLEAVVQARDVTDPAVLTLLTAVGQHGVAIVAAGLGEDRGHQDVV